jgi:hypothetical protein
MINLLFSHRIINDRYVTNFVTTALSVTAASKGAAWLSAEDSGFWDTRPKDGKLVFIGGTALMSNRDEAVRLALLDAAKKAALYCGVRGRSVSAVSIGEGSYDVYADAAVDIAFDLEYERYMEELEFERQSDVLEADNSIFVRVRWTPPIPLNISFVSRGKNRPDWITRPPETIGGYLAGVGRSNAYFHRHDTLTASYENAIGAIISTIGSDLRSGSATVETSGYAASNTSSIQNAEGSLAQFYVLEIWTDPKDKSVWTLAVAHPS